VADSHSSRIYCHAAAKESVAVEGFSACGQSFHRPFLPRCNIDFVADKADSRFYWRMRNGDAAMHYLHTMVRVAGLDSALDFYCAKLGLEEVRRTESEKGRFTLVFLAAPGDRQAAQEREAPLVELTYNWDREDYTGGRNFGHLAFAVENIYAACDKLRKAGVTINRPPRDGRMAFIRSPDGISIELLQYGESLPPQEPWLSMPNSGTW
jgi:lactoylglutathione lyase